MFRRSKGIVEAAPPGDQITGASRRAVKRYFRARGPDWVKWVLIYGSATEIVLFVATRLGVLIALVPWLTLIVMLVFLFTGVIVYFGWKREQLIDVVAACDFDRAQAVAKNRAQLTAASLRDPKCCAFLCERLDASENYGKAFVSNKLGKDERVRWTPHEIASVWVGHEQLWIHHCAIDLTTGAALYERTREVFFSDILTVVIFGKVDTYPMPPRHSKAVKASAYWGARSGVVLEDSLQVDGWQKVSLSLASGEELVLATWLGARDKGQPADAVQNRAAALRLRAWVEQGKRMASALGQGAGPRPSTGARQPRHQA